MSGELGAPDFMRAFIKVPRPVLRELLSDPLKLAVYLVVVDRAAYNAGPRLLRGHGVQHLDVGEAVIGRAEIAALCATSERSVRTAINDLRKLGFVTTKSTNLGTRIRVVGYGQIGEVADPKRPADRPASDQQNDQQTTSERPADRPLTDKRKRRNAKDEETKKEPAGVHVLRDLWGKLFKERHQQDYVFQSRDFRSLKDLEASPGMEETSRRMHIAFTAPPSFPPQPWSLATFVNNINQCAAPSKGGTKDVRVGRVEPTECDYAADQESDDVL